MDIAPRLLLNLLIVSQDRNAIATLRTLIESCQILLK